MGLTTNNSDLKTALIAMYSLAFALHLSDPIFGFLTDAETVVPALPA